MKKKTLIWITTLFTAYHRWEEAPESVSFLRSFHRHLFEVEIGMSVTHNDRDIEFFTFKSEVDEYIEQVYVGKRFSKSCEMIAKDLLDHFQASYVCVSEDGENGARVDREED